MRHKVKKEFTDNDLGYRYPEGAVIEISRERYAEMQKNAEIQGVAVSDYLEEVKEKPKGADAPTK